MARQLIVCCDGTYNVPDQRESGCAAPTNIAKTYGALLRRQARDVNCVPQYCRGVGQGWSTAIGFIWKCIHSVSAGRLDHLFGGMSGWGLSAQIRNAYTFLVNEYEAGDLIYIFGFSRGAYAARSLAGLLKHAGLLGREDAAGIREVAKAYHRFERGEKFQTTLATAKQRGRRVRVRFLGVWDTVGALGVPVWGKSYSLNPLPIAPRFHDVNAMDVVETACHALAIDEYRAAFSPVLFERERAGPGGGDLEQVWFRGAHADVGGGYADCRLSDIALRWMVDRARLAQLEIPEDGLYAVPRGNRVAEPHESLGFFGIAGTWPRWFPVACDRTSKDYEIDWGCLDASVGSGWLTDLRTGERSPNIEVGAHPWTNMRLVLRRGGRYVINGSANAKDLAFCVNARPDATQPGGKWWNALPYITGLRSSPLMQSLVKCNSIEPDRTGVLHCYQPKNSGPFTITVERMS